MHPRSKVPAVLWTQHQKERLPIETLLAHRGNFGLVTGKLSNVVIVDVDGEVGIKEATKLNLTSPCKVQTGRGFHFYYRYPPSQIVGNFVGIRPGIDIRGEGGYVLLPPSIHPSGLMYRWCAFSTNLLPEFPFELLIPDNGDNRMNGPGWIEEALKELTNGNRNNTFTRIVGRLHRDGFSPGDIRGLLSPHVLISKFNMEELEVIIGSITKRSRSREILSGSLTQFMAVEDRIEWLIDGMIASRSIGFIAGLPETNKTWFMMDLALRLANGENNGSAKKVLFIDQERFAGETKRRLRALMTGHGINPKDIETTFHIICGSSFKIDEQTSFEELKKLLKLYVPDLIVVDSFATFHTKNENQRSEIQIVLDRIKQIRDEFNCAVFFIDHENKTVLNPEEGAIPTAFTMAGSVAKVAAAETVFTFRKMDQGKSIVYHTKSTLGKAIEPFYISVQDQEEGPTNIKVIKEN